jgi:divalent metal cation (Fe/Co/Zn/Cd) transporter
VAVIISLAGAVFSIGDGVLRLLGRDVLGSGGGRLWLNFILLGVAFASEGTSLVRAWRQTSQAAREAGYGLVEWIRISKEPTTKMVLSEDLVAVTGIVVAFAGVGLREITGDQRWDASAAVLIGVLLVRGLLIGEAARPDQREALRRTVAEPDEVDEVVELLTMYLGPRSLLVAARIDLAEGLDSDHVEELSDELDRRLHDVDRDVDQVFLDATSRRATRSG